MKVIIVASIFICVAFTGKAQQTYLLASAKTNSNVVSPVFAKQRKLYGEGNYKVSMPPGFRMMKAGKTLTLFAGFMILGGGIVYGSADKSSYYDPNTGRTTPGDPKVGVGVFMMVAGVGMTVPGIILWSKGSKKYNQYGEGNEETASIQFKGNRLSLNYRF